MIARDNRPALACTVCREVKQSNFRLVNGKLVCDRCSSTFHGRAFIEPVRKVPMKCG